MMSNGFDEFRKEQAVESRAFGVFRGVAIPVIINDSVRTIAEVMKINTTECYNELVLQDVLFMKLYSQLPKELVFQRELLISRL
jgi:hypothetical protein